MTNKQIIKKKLLEEGEVSNYWLMDTRTTNRASEYIRQLREEGMEIETKMNGRECIYKLVKQPPKQVVEIVEVEGERRAVIKTI
jgi:hypothetical protein